MNEPIVGFKKPMHIGIKAEELQVGTQYAFNVSPEATPLGCEINDEKFLLFYGAIYKYFQSLKYSSYELYIEVSPIGRLHFHGYVKILKSILNFVSHDIPRLQKLGTFVIKKIEKDNNHPRGDKWYDYVRKQYNLWRYHLNGNIYGYPMCVHKEERKEII